MGRRVGSGSIKSTPYKRFMRTCGSGTCSTSSCHCLLLNAEQLLFKHFEITVANVIAQADEDGAHVDRDTAVEHRNAHVLVNGTELDVSVVGGDPVTATEIVAIFDLACQQEFDADVAARAAEHR